jgi:hypothetical protein
VQGNEARFVELRFSDYEDALGPVHVTGLKIERFTQAHTAYGQQTKQAVVGPWLELVWSDEI